MPKLWFTVIAAILCINCYGQEKGTIKIKKSEAIQITALDSKSQTLYRAVDNRIKISSALKNPKNQWSIQINYPNEISEYEKNDSVYKIMAKASSIKDSVNLMVSLFDKTSLDTICQTEKKFRIGNITDPVAVINNKYNGYISRNVLLLSKGINVILPGCDYKFDQPLFRVRSFEMIINNSEKTYLSYSESFTNEMVGTIRELSSGRTIEFVNIKAAAPDGAVRLLNDISFKIN